MKQILIFLFIGVTLFACQEVGNKNTKLITNAKELNQAIKDAQPGDELVLANGVWKDVEIKFTSKGTKKNPITLRAETAGKVSIEGVSYLKFGGEYLVVSGLHFKNGYTSSNAVIDFKLNKEQVAQHCRLTNCVIEDFNQLKRDRKDHWVEFWGRNNQMDHCYLSGKANEGPTVRVEIKGTRNIKNYHKIINNHFGPRPRKGGPKGETLQLGDSFSSMSPSNTTVANNLFEECNGEIEVISSKTNFNEFKNNVFYKCEGSLVTRHGNYCVIDGNYFIGDGVSENIGGIRIINTGHWVTNNIFFGLVGESFRSPLAVMNGIPKSPLNRYNQVTDVVVAYNSWINCASPLHFGVGVNISQADVLPKSEIRSARALRTTVANNLIYNENGQDKLVVAHDKIDGVKFKNNLADNNNMAFEAVDGIKSTQLKMNKLTDYLYIPTNTTGQEIYEGFDFETITNDVFGNSRTENKSVGAVCKATSIDPQILDKKKYGASWYSNEKPASVKKTFVASADAKNIVEKIAEASNGDVVALEAGVYNIDASLVINKSITIKSKDINLPAKIIYTGAKATPAFEMHPKGNLTLSNIELVGNYTQYAFASLQKDMSSLYNLSINECSISQFDYILKAYKETFADSITFIGSNLKNCNNGIELSEEIEDKGNYNVEFLTIDNCVFNGVLSNVIDYYRGGYDESTIGGNLLITNNTFTNCGAKEKNSILINNWGIVNVDISNNTFNNNKVKLVAQLWGAKNNTHANNKITKSGKLIVEENLKQKIVY